MIGIKFDKTIRPLVLTIPKVSGYVKTFKVKKGDNDKNNKLMSFRIDDEKNIMLFRLRLKILRIKWWQIYKNQNKNMCQYSLC